MYSCCARGHSELVLKHILKFITGNYVVLKKCACYIDSCNQVGLQPNHRFCPGSSRVYELFRA